jgi:hypothetical protein
MKPERTKAALRGRKFYKHAEPCQVQGHGVLRYVSNGACVDCCKARSRAQAQQWKQLVRQAREAGLV